MKQGILNRNFFLLIVPFLIVSCSSDDNTSEKEEQPPIAVKQFIKKIQPENPEDYQIGNQFFYDNDKLTFVFSDSCSGELIYYEYNSAGKISKEYRGNTSFEGDNFNPETFDLIEFKEHINTHLSDYVYENNKLVKMVGDDGFVYHLFSYNSKGQIEVAEYILPGIGLWEKVEVTYDNGKVVSLNKKEFDTQGKLRDNYTYTFEYDENINPFSVLYEDYGLLSLDTCTGFDYISSEDMGLKLFKNNVTKVYEDGELLYSATYQYDENKYPTRISYTNFNGNYSSIDLITYE